MDQILFSRLVNFERDISRFAERNYFTACIDCICVVSITLGIPRDRECAVWLPDSFYTSDLLLKLHFYCYYSSDDLANWVLDIIRAISTNGEFLIDGDPISWTIFYLSLLWLKRSFLLFIQFRIF